MSNQNTPRSNPQDQLHRTRKARRKHLQERLEVLRQRELLITTELGELTNDFFRVCIFGSARIKPEDSIYKLTKDLGYLLGKEGIDVLTGGGPGLMDAANQGVIQGKKDSGSKSRSFGLTIELNQFEETMPHLEVKLHHKRFSSRLDDFMRLSHAIVVVQGGIGTILELFFSWQLLQVGHLPERPIILIDTNFWKGLIDWMKDKPIARKLISPEDLRWIHFVDTPEEALEIIRTEQKNLAQKKIQNESE